MRMFSIYDLSGGKDRADFLGETCLAAGSGGADLRAFGEAHVRFYERGGTSVPCAPEGVEEMIVVMQGSGRLVINGVEHPVRSGDVVVIECGDTCRAAADEVDPFALLTISARVP